MPKSTCSTTNITTTPSHGSQGVPWKAGHEDVEQQHQSLPLPRAASSIPHALHSTAGRALSQVACLILLGWDKAGGARPTAWPRFV